MTIIFITNLFFLMCWQFTEYPVKSYVISLTYRYTVPQRRLKDPNSVSPGLVSRDFPITDLEGMKQISNYLGFCFINYKWDECCLLPAVHGVIKTSGKNKLRIVFCFLGGKYMEHKHFSILLELMLN